jgi:hypothetical protein
MISALDTHQGVKKLTAADAQAAVLRGAVKPSADIEASNFATRIGIADLRRDMAHIKPDLVKSLVGGRVRPRSEESVGAETLPRRSPANVPKTCPAGRVDDFTVVRGWSAIRLGVGVGTGGAELTAEVRR